MLSERKILNETTMPPPFFQVKWSVPKHPFIKASCFCCALPIKKNINLVDTGPSIENFLLNLVPRGLLFFRKECYGHCQMKAHTTKDDKLQQYNTLPFGSDELKKNMKLG